MTGSVYDNEPIDDNKNVGLAEWAVEAFIADRSEIIDEPQTTEELIEKREPQHGDFSKRASVAISFKFAVRQQEGWNKLSPAMQHSLDMIIEKISRILVGNPHHLDHWEDIAGYSTLVVKNLIVTALNPSVK